MIELILFIKLILIKIYTRFFFTIDKVYDSTLSQKKPIFNNLSLVAVLSLRVKACDKQVRTACVVNR